jgi:hypothetical protein
MSISLEVTMSTVVCTVITHDYCLGEITKLVKEWNLIKKNSSLPLCFGTNIFELHLIMTFCEQVCFAVHSRVIPPHASIFRVYDLKGSWKGRKVNKSKVVENVILKDMDSGFRFFLDPLIREKLLRHVNYSGSSFLSQ